MINNQLITDRRVIANEFNKYFVSLATKLNDPDDYTIINIEPVQPFTVFLRQSNPSSIYLQDSTPDEIRSTINGLENNKASDITIKIIKRSAHVISPILSKYLNQSMTRGIFPDVLKTGKITPIYKKDDKELLRTTALFPLFQFLAKFLRKLSMNGLTVFLYLSS